MRICSLFLYFTSLFNVQAIERKGSWHNLLFQFLEMNNFNSTGIQMFPYAKRESNC